MVPCPGSPPLQVGWPASARFVAMSGGDALLPFLGDNPRKSQSNELRTGQPSQIKHKTLRFCWFTMVHPSHKTILSIFINQISANGWRLQTVTGKSSQDVLNLSPLTRTQRRQSSR